MKNTLDRIKDKFNNAEKKLLNLKTHQLNLSKLNHREKKNQEKGELSIREA